jgi:hypothetical protein
MASSPYVLLLFTIFIIQIDDDIFVSVDSYGVTQIHAALSRIYALLSRCSERIDRRVNLGIMFTRWRLVSDTMTRILRFIPVSLRIVLLHRHVRISANTGLFVMAIIKCF